MLRSLSKPIRTVIRWQVAATIAFALAAGLLGGVHGAISAAAGGTISVLSCLVSAWLALAGKGKSAGGVVLGALRAEAVKLGLAVLLLWLVLANYADAVVPVFLGSFVLTMLIFSMAFFVREY
jgi:ATP synthase protein I